MDAPQVFAKIYKEDRWNGGSGPGSSPEFCRPLVAWLSRYLTETGARTLVDLGCGDFQWMPEVIAATGIRYTGIDVVPLDAHRPGPGVSFHHLDISTADPAGLPDADLYWSKDVLQHWPTNAITRWLDRFFSVRPAAHLLVANCAGQRYHARTLDDRWHFAPLEGTRKPLNMFDPELLFVWSGKHCYRLHQRSLSTAARMSD